MITRMLGLFRRRSGEAWEVQAALAQINRRKQTIRLELERTLIRFNSRLVVRSSAVVVAKPAALGAELQAGVYVRFKVPDHPQHWVRMEVVTPHFTLTNKQPVFLCRVPTEFCTASPRKSERFDTRRFSNLRLELPGHAHAFHIVDLSELGLRVATPYPRPRERLPLSQAIGDAVIRMGKHVSVQLAMATPRSYDSRTVGMAIAVDPNGDHRKLLHHLLHTLDTQQREHLQAEAL